MAKTMCPFSSIAWQKYIEDETEKEKEMWEGSNAEKRCKNCRWFINGYEEYGDGYCFLEPPTTNGRPITSPNSFCSRFESE